MTALLCTLYGFAWSAEVVAPTLGAATLEPSQARLRVVGGLDTVFPTVGLGALVGLVPGWDLDLDVTTRAGLAWSASARVRAGLGEHWAGRVRLVESFTAVEDLSGIQIADAPFSNRVGVEPTLAWSGPSAAGVHLAVSGGVTVRTWVARRTADGTRRELDPAVDAVHASVGAEWTGERGSTTLAVRALTPIDPEFRVLGYLPWVTVGRTWGVR